MSAEEGTRQGGDHHEHHDEEGTRRGEHHNERNDEEGTKLGEHRNEIPTMRGLDEEGTAMKCR